VSVEVVPDEVEQVVSFEGGGFVTRLGGYIGEKNNLRISIPVRLVRKLNLTKGCIVEVLIRKVSEEYCMEKYGKVPKSRRRSSRIIMKCPRCGRLGVVGLERYKGKLRMYFDHFGVDGTTHRFVIKRDSKMISMARRVLMLGKNFKTGQRNWCRVEGILRRLEGEK